MTTSTRTRRVASVGSAAVCGLLFAGLTAGPADAASRDGEITRTAHRASLTVKTDGMPTRVDVMRGGAYQEPGRINCVEVHTGAGKDRRVTVTYGRVKATVDLEKRDRSGCLRQFTGVRITRPSSLTIRVVEDMTAPLPDQTATGRLPF